MKLLDLIKDYCVITLGIFIAAVGVFFFLVPSGLAVGSVSGLALVLSHFMPLTISVITMILNVGLLLLGFLFIGRDFGVKTIYTSLMLPVFLGIFEVIFPNFSSMTEDPFLDMLCYLFVVSIGQAILFQCNASSGGLDIVGKIINKFFHMELGKAISMCGLCVALLSILVSDRKAVILSILGTYLSGIILDHFIFGFNLKRRVCIISDFILKNLHSGATIYDAYGAYHNQVRKEIVTIVNKSEYSQLMNFLSKTDKDAFITVYAVNEVLYRPKV